MKLFEEQKREAPKEPQPIVTDTAEFMKRNLMKSVTQVGAVREAIEKWVYSFQGGISRISFIKQINRLDWNDETALTQLTKAMGRRIIPLPPPPKHPELKSSVVEQIVETSYLALYGRGFKESIKTAIAELKQYGTVYVLSIEKLIVEFKSYKDKGQAPQMIDDAVDCDFLFIVDLERAIHLEWRIREAIERIGRLREEAQKVIVSTWTRCNDCNKFYERFKIFEVK